MHEEVERHQSRLRAQNAIERVAVAGRFTAVSFNSAGIVFEKEADGTVTRLSIRKVGPKVFESVHETISLDTGKKTSDMKTPDTKTSSVKTPDVETAPDTQRPEVGGTIPIERVHVGVIIPIKRLHERRRK